MSLNEITNTRSWKATCSRWLDLIFMICIASVLCVLVDPFILKGRIVLTSAISSLPLSLQIAAILILSAAIWIPIIRLGGFRFSDFISGSLIYYPPTWFGGTVGAAVFIIAAYMPQYGLKEVWKSPYLIDFLIALGLAFPGGLLFAVVCNRCPIRVIRKQKVRSPEAETLQKLLNNPAALRNWIYNERPIEDPDHDLFDYKIIAYRMSQLIGHSQERHIGLIGPYGAGKSSLLKMLEHYIHCDFDKRSNKWALKHSWHICRLDAWGRDPDKFAEQLLRVMIANLSRRVDVLSIITMPRHYTEAISATGSAWLSIPSALLNANSDPIACLRKLDNILAATRSRMLIFVEDLDRNSSEDFLNDQLPALLDRIRQLKNVYFVFAIGSEKESAQILMRITQHLESLDSINRAHTKEIVMAFRNACMDKYPEDIDPVDSKDRDSRLRLISKPIVDTYSIEGFLSGEYPGTHDYVADALSNPRVLKQVLRRVDRAWIALHGEIDFDDLFITHLLRYVYKEAYAFLLNNLHSFRSMNDRESDDDGAKRKRAELAKDLESALKLSDIEIVDNLIQSLFPTWKKDRYATNHQSPQGIRHSVPTDYWSRLQYEHVTTLEIPDQSILSGLKTWQQDHLSNYNNKALARWIVDSREASAKVKHFSYVLSGEDIRALASQVFSIILERDGNVAAEGSCHAFTDLCRAALDSRCPGHMDWLEAEIAKALPISLQFVNDLYEYWRIQSSSEISFPPDTADLRKYWVTLAKDLWKADVQTMIKGLSPKHPAALYLFVTELDKADITKSGFDHAEWQWCYDTMIDVLRKSPDRVASQFVPFTTYQSGGLNKSFWINVKLSERMFGDKLSEVIKLLNQYLNPDAYEGLHKRQVACLKQFCQEWTDAESIGEQALKKLKIKYEGTTEPDGR